MVTMTSRYLLLVLSLFLAQSVIAQDDLEQRVTVLETEVVQINDDVDIVENSVVQNTGQIFEIVNDLDDLDDVNDLQETRIGAVEEENSLLRARLDQMEVLLSSLSGDVQVLNKTLSDLDNDNSTNERLDALESDVTTLESDVTDLENSVDELDNSTNIQFDILEGDITALEADITALESDVTGLGESTDQRLDALEENIVDYSHTAFLVTHSIYEFVPTDPIVWDSAILNPGGHYNPDTGIYTVPVDGIYQFVLHYRNYLDTASGAWLEVDNVRMAYTYEGDVDFYDNSNNLMMALSLTSGQGVGVRPSVMGTLLGTDSSGIIHSWFSGHLIYAL